MRLALLLLPVAFVAAVACSNATDGVVGGEPLPVIAQAAECSATGPACSTWTYLYNCYFGPTGLTSCSGQSGCHLVAGSIGFDGSGFVCGPTSDTCWHGMTVGTPGFPIPVNPALIATPKKTALYAALHKSTGMTETTVNNMPLKNIVDQASPAYTFTSSDLACIEGWITAGAKED